MPKTEEICHFRLINSEEVIAEVIAETDHTFIVRNPYIVIELETSVSLAKYVPFSANQSIELKKSHIITATELHEEMVRYYKNTITIGRTTSDKAMEGLARVNELMESYIYDGVVPNPVDYVLSNFVPSSNSIH